MNTCGEVAATLSSSETLRQMENNIDIHSLESLRRLLLAKRLSHAAVSPVLLEAAVAFLPTVPLRMDVKNSNTAMKFRLDASVVERVSAFYKESAGTLVDTLTSSRCNNRVVAPTCCRAADTSSLNFGRRRHTGELLDSGCTSRRGLIASHSARGGKTRCLCLSSRSAAASFGEVDSYHQSDQQFFLLSPLFLYGAAVELRDKEESGITNNCVPCLRLAHPATGWIPLLPVWLLRKLLDCRSVECVASAILSNPGWLWEAAKNGHTSSAHRVLTMFAAEIATVHQAIACDASRMPVELQRLRTLYCALFEYEAHSIASRACRGGRPTVIHCALHHHRTDFAAMLMQWVLSMHFAPGSTMCIGLCGRETTMPLVRECCVCWLPLLEGTDVQRRSVFVNAVRSNCPALFDCLRQVLEDERLNIVKHAIEMRAVDDAAISRLAERSERSTSTVAHTIVTPRSDLFPSRCPPSSISQFETLANAHTANHHNELRQQCHKVFHLTLSVYLLLLLPDASGVMASYFLSAASSRSAGQHHSHLIWPEGRAHTRQHGQDGGLSSLRPSYHHPLVTSFVDALGTIDRCTLPLPPEEDDIAAIFLAQGEGGGDQQHQLEPWLAFCRRASQFVDRTTRLDALLAPFCLDVDVSKHTTASLKLLVSPDNATNPLNLPIHRACRLDSPSVVFAILAMWYRNPQWTQRQLSALPSIDARTSEGCTPLWLAASKGSVEVCEMLLGCGARANVTSNQGVSALEAAVKSGRRGVVTLLLHYGAEVSNEVRLAAQKVDTIMNPVRSLAEGEGSAFARAAGVDIGSMSSVEESENDADVPLEDALGAEGVSFVLLTRHYFPRRIGDLRMTDLHLNVTNTDLHRHSSDEASQRHLHLRTPSQGDDDMASLTMVSLVERFLPRLADDGIESQGALRDVYVMVTLWVVIGYAVHLVTCALIELGTW